MGKLLITVFGDAGSGKGTVLRALADVLGCTLIDMGDILREFANELDISLHELHEKMLADPSWDARLDDRVRNLPNQHERLIIVSRTAWHLHPTSIRVYLACREDVTAKRIAERENVSVEAALEKERTRVLVDADRYRRYLGIEIYPPPHELFQVVLDTSDLTPQEVRDQLIKRIQPFVPDFAV